MAVAKRPETRFRAQLSVALRGCGAKSQPIESEGTGEGIPDLYVVHVGMAMWIECKHIAADWPCQRKVPFRKFQYPWLMENDRKGGFSFIAVRYLNGYLFQNVSTLDSVTMRPSPTASLFLSKMDGELVLKWLHTFRSVTISDPVYQGHDGRRPGCGSLC